MLPAGWISARDPSSGRPYFANPSTGETRWDPPPRTTTALPQQPPLQSGPVLPPVIPPQPVVPAYHPFVLENTVQLAPTVQEPLGLVSKAHVMVQTEARRKGMSIDTTQSGSPSSSTLEYPSMSAGMLADLCRIQQQNNNLAPYDPVQPLLMSPSDVPPHTEEGRLDIRLATLYDQLNRT